MELNSTRTDDVLVITTCNRVDGSNASDFQDSLKHLIRDSDRAVVIDFASMTYISSAGLRAMLVTAKNLKRSNARFAICSLSDSIREVFAISGFDKIIAIYATAGQAIVGVKN